MKRDLIELGFDVEDNLFEHFKIAMDDISHFREIYTHQQIEKIPPLIDKYVEHIDIREERNYEEHLEKQ